MAATPLWLIAVILACRSVSVGLVINPLLQALVQPLRPDQLGALALPAVRNTALRYS